MSIYKNENFDSVCSGPLATNTTCCYCYSEYPRFVLVDSVEKWHNHVLPLKEQDRNSQPDAYENNYWFCAEERENGLARNWTHVDAPAFQSSSSNQSRVALVTGKFSHNNSFQTEVNAHCRRVLATGFFSQDGWDLFCYGESPDFVVQNPRFQRHMRYRTDPDDLSAKGGGYWFHKSVLLRHHMNQYGDGDYLIWTDIDRLDFVRQGSFNAILETMATRKDDLLIESMAWSSEHIFTKGDMLAAFNASETLRQSLQVNANAIVFRVSPGMKRFINAWIECVSDWHMVSDEQSVIPNSPDYHDHRHDQSILGLLIKKFMTRQSAVGPPARTYHQRSHYHTFKLLDNVYPLCPFTSFYSAAYVANIGTKSKKGQ